MNHCCICNLADCTSNPLVADFTVANIEQILEWAEQWVNAGELKYKPLLESLSSLKSQNRLAEARYHTKCRGNVIHSLNLKRKEDSQSRSVSSSLGGPLPKKRGRPPTRSRDRSMDRSRRGTSAAAKERVCMFGSCSFCADLKASSDTNPLMGVDR
jgi:hypothetical protein